MSLFDRTVKASGCARFLIVAVACAGFVALAHGQQTAQLTIHWDQKTVTSKTTPTLQVVVNPPLRPGEALSEASYKAVKELGAD